MDALEGLDGWGCWQHSYQLNQRCGFYWKAAGGCQRTAGEGVQLGLVREEPADPGLAISVSIVCLYFSPSLLPLLSTPVLSFLILSGTLLYDNLKTFPGSLVPIASLKGHRGVQCPLTHLTKVLCGPTDNLVCCKVRSDWLTLGAGVCSWPSRQQGMIVNQFCFLEGAFARGGAMCWTDAPNCVFCSWTE